MLVYDITNPKSFEQLDSWREEFLHQVDHLRDCAVDVESGGAV